MYSVYNQNGGIKMIKKIYEEPEMEIVNVEMEDVITNSNELPIIPTLE